jgi:hypothetical protein
MTASTASNGRRAAEWWRQRDIADALAVSIMDVLRHRRGARRVEPGEKPLPADVARLLDAVDRLEAAWEEVKLCE